MPISQKVTTINKCFTLSILILALTACNNKTNPINKKKSLVLMKEGADFIILGINIEFSDSLKAATYYRQATNKFLEAIRYDPTNKKLGIYLPDVYSKLRLSDSVIYWRNWLNPEDR